jgi:tetratricopeptide (TPR) repeat protein
MDSENTEPRLEFRLLGAIEALYDGRSLDLGGVLSKSVLAVLLLNHGQTVPTALIADLVRSGETADSLIAACVSRLREALRPAGDRIRLRSTHPGFRADVDPRLVDACRLKTLIAQADRHRGAHEDDLAATSLREALELWRGNVTALSDLPSSRLREYAEPLETLRLDALERLARIELRAGRPEQARALLYDVDPPPERQELTMTLIHALTALGEPARAADLAARTAKALVDLGREPGPELTAALTPRPPTPTTPSGPRQLPADTSAFTGRVTELARLRALADLVASDISEGVVTTAIDGMAGVGKTALAIHAGHALSDRFPDGQLFLDLRGCSQGGTPREPADALAAVLRAFGIPPQQIPADLDERAALYRHRLAGTRTLIVLDNAAAEAQVRALLPGDRGCLVVVTSRKRLKALDDAHPVQLDVLPMADAVRLLREVAGRGRTEANDPLLEQIAVLCGRLPLALRIAAALVRSNSAWNLRRLADRLSDRRASHELEAFSDGDRQLTAVFDLSYQSLTDDQRGLFRRLGLVPGPDIDAHAAAALVDTDTAEAERLLQHLVDHNLLTEPAPGRYQMHDLASRHARDRTDRDDCAADRDGALRRLLHYYQHTAAFADAQISRHTRPGPLGAAPTCAPALPTPDAGRAWLRIERTNLLACIELAAGRGWDAAVIGLTAGSATLLRTDGPWPQALALHTEAVAAAERCGSQPDQAAAMTELGVARRLTGDYTGAARTLTQAMDLYRGLGIVRGEADAMIELGTLHRLIGDYPSATRDLEPTLKLYHDLHDLRGQANAMIELGVIRRLTGNYPDAAHDLKAALEIYRDLKDSRGQANALTRLGAMSYLTGDYTEAARDLDAALELYRGLSDRLGQANVLSRLGSLHYLTGDCPGATRDQEAALELYRGLGDRLGEAYALTELGIVRRRTGDYPAAAHDLGLALKLLRQIGSRGNESWALNHYAAVLAANGDLEKTLALHRDALLLARELDMPDEQAVALEGIGECHLRAGDSCEATASLTKALTIFQRLRQSPDIERVETRLAELSEV